MRTAIPILVVLLVAIMGNAIEYLTDKGYSSTLILFWAGCISFFMNGILLIKKNQPFFPKQPKLQLIRFFTTGISSFLIFESYKYLAAGSVSLVQRADIPLVILISMFSGEKRSSLQFWLSIWVLAVIGFMVLDSKFIDEDPIGFVYVFSGVALVSFSYLLVKKSAATENVYVISNINSLGAMAVGVFLMITRNGSWNMDPWDSWAFVLVGLCMFLIYVAGIHLYKWYSAERARFPFIIGAVATMCIEMVIEQKFFSVSQIALSLLIAGMIATISLNAPAPGGKWRRGKRINLSQGLIDSVGEPDQKRVADSMADEVQIEHT